MGQQLLLFAVHEGLENRICRICSPLPTNEVTLGDYCLMLTQALEDTTLNCLILMSAL